MQKVKRLYQWFRKGIADLNSSTDLRLLLFLLLILQVSLAVKLLGIIYIYFSRPDFKFGLKQGRLPLFYLTMMILVVLGYALNADRGFNYAILAALSFLFWGAAFLVIHQTKLAIEKSGVARVDKALRYFFILNAIITAIDLLRIIVEIKSINPYVYVGFNYKYFASTGDFLRGITMDLSTVNNIMNSLGVFYFLYRRTYAYSLLCFLVAVFTTSNVGNFVLLSAFLYVLFTSGEKLRKSIVFCYLIILVVFAVKISPSNLNYLNNKIQSVFHLQKPLFQRKWDDSSEKDKLLADYVDKKAKTPEKRFENRKVIRKIIAVKEKEGEVKSRLLDSISLHEEKSGRNKFYVFFEQYYGDTVESLNQQYYDRYPGKYLSFIETFEFLQESPAHLLLGAGPGNFSSKLAFKASNLGISGKYVDKYKYIAPEFLDRHLKLTLRYYLKPISEHSVINFPNSVLNQLLGEYGLPGLLLFFIFYVWFFLRNIRKYTYGKILLPMCLLFLLTDYWFESLSMVVMFEIMMLIDLAGQHKTKSLQ